MQTTTIRHPMLQSTVLAPKTHAAAASAPANGTTPNAGTNGTGGTGSTSNTNAATGSSADATGNPNATLNESDFITLLVTQLQNQDPLNTVPPDQLASELAQFTSVSELQQLNSQFANQVTATNSNTAAVQASLGESLIGRQVIGTGNQVDVSGNTTSVIADIGGSGGVASLTLSDGNGNTVGTFPLGPVQAGRQVLSFPTNGVKAGPYTYALKVTDPSGNSVSSTTYMAGTVNGVDLSNGAPTLDLGDLTLPISNLIEVLPVQAAANSN